VTAVARGEDLGHRGTADVAAKLFQRLASPNKLTSRARTRDRRVAPSLRGRPRRPLAGGRLAEVLSFLQDRIAELRRDAEHIMSGQRGE
jgi:hypothetical protein